MALSWSEKYRPRRLSEIGGNPTSLRDLAAWADQWKAGPPKQRAVILAGPPGCGKTTSVVAVAAERGWGLIELNASDARSEERIRRVAGQGAVHAAFSDEGGFTRPGEGHRTLILLDEADSLYERASGGSTSQGVDYSDRGGKRAIIETIRETKQPVVLVVNDAYALTKGGGARLRSLARTIQFRRLTAETVAEVLRRVADAEGLRVPPDVLKRIAQHAQGDLRSAVNDLEALSAGRGSLQMNDLASLGYRDQPEAVWDVLRTIFRSQSLRDSRRAASEAQEPPDFLMAWIDENLPAEYEGPDERVAGYEALSRADRFLGRVRRRQSFGLWSYARDWMSGGVTVARHRPPRGYVRYQFPSKLRHMSRTRASRAVREAALSKIGAALHSSRRKVLSELLPVLRPLLAAQRELTERVALEWNLETDEVEYVLGPDADDAYVSDVARHVQRMREEGVTPDRAFFSGPGQDEEAVSGGENEEPDPEPKQTKRTLLDF